MNYNYDPIIIDRLINKLKFCRTKWSAYPMFDDALSPQKNIALSFNNYLSFHIQKFWVRT